MRATNSLAHLTAGQARMLARHRRGLARLARVLSGKIGRDPTDLMFVLAHERSNVGSIAREQRAGRVVAGTEAIIVPGLATELPTWVERLALAGPVHDCTNGLAGVVVIIIDEHNDMAVCRLAAVSNRGR